MADKITYGIDDDILTNNLFTWIIYISIVYETLFRALYSEHC